MRLKKQEVVEPVLLVKVISPIECAEPADTTLSIIKEKTIKKWKVTPEDFLFPCEELFEWKQ